MRPEMRTIEIDDDTATALERRAAERGITVAQLVAELVPVVPDSEAIAELERRWREAQAKDGAAAHEDVARWLRTWGTPAFRPWRPQ